MKYINNNELAYEVILSQGKGIVSNKLVALWTTLTLKIIEYKYNQYHQELKEMALSDSLFDLCRYYNKYNRNRSSNVFSWATEVINSACKKSYNQYVYGTSTNVKNKKERKHISYGIINDLNL